MNKKEQKEKLFRSRNKLLGLIILLFIVEFIQFIVMLDNEYKSSPILGIIETIIIFITVVYSAVVITNIIIYLENEDKTNSKVE